MLFEGVCIGEGEGIKLVKTSLVVFISQMLTKLIRSGRGNLTTVTHSIGFYFPPLWEDSLGFLQK